MYKIVKNKNILDKKYTIIINKKEYIIYPDVIKGKSELLDTYYEQKDNYISDNSFIIPNVDEYNIDSFIEKLYGSRWIRCDNKYDKNQFYLLHKFFIADKLLNKFLDSWKEVIFNRNYYNNFCIFLKNNENFNCFSNNEIDFINNNRLIEKIKYYGDTNWTTKGIIHKIGGSIKENNIKTIYNIFKKYIMKVYNISELFADDILN